MVAVLIFGVGAGVSVIEGIDKIRHPHVVADAWLIYLVLAFGILFEGAVWLVALREFRSHKGSQGWLEAIRHSKDPTVFTVLFEDTAALLGLFTALIGIWLAQALDLPILDGVASIVIGVILAGAASFLAWECKSLLTGEGASPQIQAGIRRIIDQEPLVARTNEVLTMHFGPQDVLLALSVDFIDRCGAVDVEQAVTRIERRVRAAHPEITRVFVEAQDREAHRLVEEERTRARLQGETGDG